MVSKNPEISTELEIPEEISGLRMTRQRLLDSPNRPLLRALLDESILRRPVGGI